MGLAAKPIVYTIAGSDSGGGAGIQADLLAIHNMKCHGCSAITCLTAQNSVGVTGVHTPPVDFLRQQIETLWNDLPPMAIKIGMLGSKEMVMQTYESLRDRKEGVGVVLDPVMISTSGHRLIQEDAQQAMVDLLFPMVDIITPNKYEAEAFIGKKIVSIADVEDAARTLITMGAKSVLIKGGHADDVSFSQDYFLTTGKIVEGEARICDGERGVWLRSSRYTTDNTHGTGCTLSSAIASALALGTMERAQSRHRRGAYSSINVIDACCLAKAYVTAGIFHGSQLGRGPGPVAQTFFPNSHQHFPSIALDPAKRPTPFHRMASSDIKSDSLPRLGRILPIVDTVEWVQKLCKIEGVEDIQLRIKDETASDKILKRVKEAQAICGSANVRLWINDHWKAAIDAGCFGVHVGQEDLFKCANAGGLDMIQNAGLALGVSTHSFAELSVALGVRPSYISLGPVLPTSSKKVNFDPQGLETVAKWRELIPPEICLVTIGGIGDAETASQVKQSGADCVAVIGAVLQAKDPAAAISSLNKAIQSC
jgi:hydroxymethylpyrimidine kinase/phosphomethylpyrimidine kinase/thiamine-phosphate diphosphorylase